MSKGQMNRSCVLVKRFCKKIMAEALDTESRMQKPKVLVIAGTTAVGKTDLSIELTKILNGEVISADSAQVFRKVNIGTAKVEAEICEQVPHHLLDVANIGEIFSAGNYRTLAEQAVQDIRERGRVPLVVGGTGLYLRSLIRGPSGAPPSTHDSRAMIDRLVEEEDGGKWDESLARLKTLDPEYASSLFPNDWYRLKRALEICTLSGRTVTSYKWKQDEENCPYEYKCLFLSMPRLQLFQRIDARCETIIQQGLFQEVISLVRNDGLVQDTQAGRCVGYRQALEYLKSVWGFPPNNDDMDDCSSYSLKVPREKLRQSFLDFIHNYQAKTRGLAQDQLIWFKKDPSFQWLNVAPGGERLPLQDVARAVAEWFNNNVPFPQEWDGKVLQTLTNKETKMLKTYSAQYQKLLVYSNPVNIDQALEQIETCLKESNDSCI